MLSLEACHGMLLHVYACRVHQSLSGKEHLEHLSRICRKLVEGTGTTSINTLNFCHVGESREGMHAYHLWEQESERAQCDTWHTDRIDHVDVACKITSFAHHAIGI